MKNSITPRKLRAAYNQRFYTIIINVLSLFAHTMRNEGVIEFQFPKSLKEYFKFDCPVSQPISQLFGGGGFGWSLDLGH